MKMRGFVLPTVLITSVVMMIVLLSALTATTSVSTAIKGQYVDRLTKEASESGLAMANACLKANGNVAKWNNTTNTLRPYTDCSGTALSGLTGCPGSDAAGCYVLKTGNYRASYSVTYTKDTTTGKVTDLQANATVSQVRTSNAAAQFSLEGFVQKQTVASQSAGGGGTISQIISIGRSGGYTVNGTTYSYSDDGRALCGVNSDGKVWCAGVGRGADPGASLGPTTCYKSDYVTKISCSGGSTPAYFFTDLSDSTSGMFRNKTVTSVAEFDSRSSGDYAALCITTDAGKVFCAGSKDSNTYMGNLSYNGGKVTCYNTDRITVISGCSSQYSLYLSDLSDATVGIFRGKTMASLGSPANTLNLCGVTTVGAVWCATNNTGNSDYYGAGATVWTNGGPVTCYAGNGTNPCSGSYLYYDPPRYLISLSDPSSGIFRGKTAKSVEMGEDTGTPAYFSAPMCITTTAGEVWCAYYLYIPGSDLEYTNYFDGSGSPFDLRISGGPSTCYAANRTSSITCTFNPYNNPAARYFLTNLSDATSGIFRGKPMRTIITRANGGYDGTLCGVTTGNEVWCANETDANQVNNGRPPSDFNTNSNLTYNDQSVTCYAANRTTVRACTLSTARIFLSNISTATGMLNGKPTASALAFKIDDPTICAVTTGNEIWCTGGATYQVSTAFYGKLGYLGGPVTCYASNRTTVRNCNTDNDGRYFLTNLSATSGSLLGPKGSTSPQLVY